MLQCNSIYETIGDVEEKNFLRNFFQLSSEKWKFSLIAYGKRIFPAFKTGNTFLLKPQSTHF